MNDSVTALVPDFFYYIWLAERSGFKERNRSAIHCAEDATYKLVELPFIVARSVFY